MVDGPSANDLDFRKRFERSMDRNNPDSVANREKKKRERVGRDLKNYLS